MRLDLIVGIVRTHLAPGEQNAPESSLAQETADAKKPLIFARRSSAVPAMQRAARCQSATLLKDSREHVGILRRLGSPPSLCELRDLCGLRSLRDLTAKRQPNEKRPSHKATGVLGLISNSIRFFALGRRKRTSPPHASELPQP